MKLFADLTKKRNIYLMIEETVNFKDIALVDLSLIFDFLL